MIGRHRGSRSLRWRLVNAVIAAALGRGYEGRHRLEVAALGLPLTARPVASGAADGARSGAASGAASEAASPSVLPPLPVAAQAASAAPVGSPTSLTHASGARLAVVPVVASPDPLVDTVPHPVVKLFPLPVVATAVEGEQAVFADVEQAREDQVTAELAAGSAPPSSYHGRHSA